MPAAGNIDWASRVGLLRSLFLYYGMPWRQRALRRFYATLLRPGDLAFDVGAHVGNRTRALLALGAEVVAVEPQPLCLRFLAATLPRERLRLLGAAVGELPGRATLHVSRRHPTVSTLSSRWAEQVGARVGFEHVAWDAQISVEVITLDALIARFGLPQFLKLDIEGLEASALSGLSHPIPLVAVEYLPAAPEVAHACISRLSALGPYRYNLVAGERHRFLLPHWSDVADVHQELTRRLEEGRSGDIYARLPDPKTNEA
jgi:FkbM family methyltransferase